MSTQRVASTLLVAVAIGALLAGCAGGAPEPKPEAERPASDGSNLPFDLPEAGSGSGGSKPGGSEAVSVDGAEITDTDWDVSCSPDAKDTYAVTARGDNDSYVSVLMDDQGKFERVEFTITASGGDDLSYWYWVDEHEPGSDTELEFNGPNFGDDSVAFSGEIYEYSDYEYKTPYAFEVTLDCDTTG